MILITFYYLNMTGAIAHESLLEIICGYVN